MSLSRIIQDAEKEEEEDEEEEQQQAPLPPTDASAPAAAEQRAASEGEKERVKVCVVPRMACREIKVALEGAAAPLFHLKEWNVSRRFCLCPGRVMVMRPP